MLRTSFYSQITFSVVGRGPKWSNMPKFHKGDPVRSSGKQNRCQAIYVARNFLVAFLLKHFSPGEIWGWRKVKQMQPMWLCLFSCIQFEETYENAHQRKVIQMQPMWPCFFSYKQFEGTNENPNWRKIKQMQPMWQCLLWSNLFEEKKKHLKTHSGERSNKCNQS